MASVTMWGFLFLLMSIVPVGAEVVRSMSDCAEFLLEETPPHVPGVLEDGNILNQNRYKPICQTFESRRRFLTLYDIENKIPVFSAYKYIGNMAVTRPNSPWKIEPQLEDEMIGTSNVIYKNQAGNNDYKNKLNLDKGHLFPNSHALTAADKISTFTLTNIVPQAASFNQQSWNKMESCVKCVLEKYCINNNQVHEGFVVVGAQPSSGKYLNNRVNIPSMLWSAFCCYSDSLNKWIASAHWGDNVPDKHASKYLTTRTLAELYETLSTATSSFKVFSKRQCPLHTTVAEFYSAINVENEECKCPPTASTTSAPATSTSAPSTTTTGSTIAASTTSLPTTASALTQSTTIPPTTGPPTTTSIPFTSSVPTTTTPQTTTIPPTTITTTTTTTTAAMTTTTTTTTTTATTTTTTTKKKEDDKDKEEERQEESEREVSEGEGGNPAVIPSGGGGGVGVGGGLLGAFLGFLGTIGGAFAGAFGKAGPGTGAGLNPGHVLQPPNPPIASKTPTTTTTAAIPHKPTTTIPATTTTTTSTTTLVSVAPTSTSSPKITKNRATTVNLATIIIPQSSTILPTMKPQTTSTPQTTSVSVTATAPTTIPRTTTTTTATATVTAEGSGGEGSGEEGSGGEGSGGEGSGGEGSGGFNLFELYFWK